MGAFSTDAVIFFCIKYIKSTYIGSGTLGSIIGESFFKIGKWVQTAKLAIHMNKKINRNIEISFLVTSIFANSNPDVQSSCATFFENAQTAKSKFL